MCLKELYKLKKNFDSLCMEQIGNLENIKESNDFVDFLREELLKRCRQNESYSLRAFARDLCVEASALSKILRRQRKISDRMIERFSEKLNLSPDEARALMPKDSISFRLMSEDVFRVISDWHHFAILELSHLKSFRPEENYICEALGLTKYEVRAAIERLQRLNLLEINEFGHWIDRGENLSTLGIKGTGSPYKKLQKQVLEKAIYALNEIPFEDRDQSSITIAMNSQKMEKAKELLKSYRRDFIKQMENYETADHLYHFSLSFYPITKKNVSRGES